MKKYYTRGFIEAAIFYTIAVIFLTDIFSFIQFKYIIVIIFVLTGTLVLFMSLYVITVNDEDFIWQHLITKKIKKIRYDDIAKFQVIKSSLRRGLVVYSLSGNSKKHFLLIFAISKKTVNILQEKHKAFLIR